VAVASIAALAAGAGVLVAADWVALRIAYRVSAADALRRAAMLNAITITGATGIAWAARAIWDRVPEAVTSSTIDRIVVGWKLRSHEDLGVFLGVVLLTFLIEFTLAEWLDGRNSANNRRAAGDGSRTLAHVRITPERRAIVLLIAVIASLSLGGMVIEAIRSWVDSVWA
jgi:hypothetical protein